MAKAELIRDLDSNPDSVGADGRGVTSRSQKLWKVGDHHVITSTSCVYGEPETYVFPADADGKITDWGELEGSFRGSLNHQVAIDGYVETQS